MSAKEIAQKIMDDAFDEWTMNHDKKQYMGAFDLDEAESIIAAALAEKCDDCDRNLAINAFRMDELDAVMLSVDKWLDGPALKNNPATRAADAREVALKAIEAEQSKLAEQDKEIARMRGAIATFAKGQSWAAQGWKDQPHIKPLFDIAALLPPAAKEVER